MFPDQSFLGTILCLENLDDTFFLIKFNSNTLLCNQQAPRRLWSSCPISAHAHILLPIVLKAMDSMSFILCQPKQWQVVFPLLNLFIYFCLCILWYFLCVSKRLKLLYCQICQPLHFLFWLQGVCLVGWFWLKVFVILWHPLSWFILFLYISSLRS